MQLTADDPMDVLYLGSRFQTRGREVNPTDIGHSLVRQVQRLRDKSEQRRSSLSPSL